MPSITRKKPLKKSLPSAPIGSICTPHGSIPFAVHPGAS